MKFVEEPLDFIVTACKSNDEATWKVNLMIILWKTLEIDRTTFYFGDLAN